MDKITQWFGLSQYEPKKVAISSESTRFLYEVIFQLIPLGVSIYIVCLNLVGLYLGTNLPGPGVNDSVKLVLLQVLSKIFELLCIASIASFILAFIRHYATNREGIPFAAITSSIDFRSLSYLWSPEYRALWIASGMARGRRMFFVLALFLSVLIVTFIGPATAILIRPRQDWWPAGGTEVWIDTTLELLFPPIFDESTLPKQHHCMAFDGGSCPSSGWGGLKIWLQAMKWNDRRMPAHNLTQHLPASGLTFVTRDVQVSPIFWLQPYNVSYGTWSWMYAPNGVMARAISEAVSLWAAASEESQRQGETKFATYMDRLFGMHYLTSYVSIACNATRYDPETPPCAVFPLTEPESRQNVVTICDNIQLNRWITRDFAPGTPRRPRLHWFDGNQYGPNMIQLEIPGGFDGGALLTLPSTFGQDDWMVGCTFYAEHRPMLYFSDQFVANPIKITPWVETVPIDLEFDDPAAYRATLKPSWLEALNPPLPLRNSTVFEELLHAASGWQDSPEGSIPYPNRVEAVLLGMIGNGFTRVQPLTYPVTAINNYRNETSVGPWWRALMPQNGVFGPGGNAYNVTADVQARALTTTVYAAVSGWGYAYLGSAGIFWSVITVLVYAGFVVIALVIRVLFHGLCTSNSWSSPTKLMALALESTPFDDEFKNTTAGIDTPGPLKQMVCILPRNRRLQMVESEGVNSDDESIRADVAY